jgi:hypothetical protein
MNRRGLALCAASVLVSACRDNSSRVCAERVCFSLVGEVRHEQERHRHALRPSGRTGWIGVQSFATEHDGASLDVAASLLRQRYESIGARVGVASRVSLGGHSAARLDVVRTWRGAPFRRVTWLLALDGRWIAVDVTAAEPQFDAELAALQPVVLAAQIAPAG